MLSRFGVGIDDVYAGLVADVEFSVFVRVWRVWVLFSSLLMVVEPIRIFASEALRHSRPPVLPLPLQHTYRSVSRKFAGQEINPKTRITGGFCVNRKEETTRHGLSLELLFGAGERSRGLLIAFQNLVGIFEIFFALRTTAATVFF